MNIKISIIYPTDPFGQKVGGVETFVKGFIKYSPDDVDIELIGVTSDGGRRRPRRRISVTLGNKKFDFFPIFLEKNENKKTLIPLFFRFTLALKFARIEFSDKLLLFNRIEPLILFKNTANPKIAFIHTDVQKQIEKQKSEVLWSAFPGLYFIFEKMVFKYLNYIYTVSSDTLKFYKSKYVNQQNKFLFLPTWVDTEIFFPSNVIKRDLKRKLSSEILEGLLPEDMKWILFVGRLQEVKAPFRLIDSFVEYNKKNKASSLIIIGDGNLRGAMVERVKNMSHSRNIHFLGSMPQERLADFYRASDVLLLTSNFEGMPRCVLESLGCGTPVVSTNVGEVKRVAKNGVCGEVVDSFSPDEIAAAMEKILNNPARYTKENCVNSVEEYTPKNILKPVYEKIRALYHEKYGARVNICGIEIDNLSFQEALDKIGQIIVKREPSYVVTPNIDHIVKLHKDHEFRECYKKASIVLVDGMPIIWAARFLKTPLKEKVSGSDLFPKLCELSSDRGYRLFFLGGRPGAAARAAEILKIRYPGTQITGVYSPPFGFEDDEAENGKIIDMIKRAKPDILFVGLGAPKQEKWICKHKAEYDVPVSIGIGASFEFVSGMIKRAPSWMQKGGLEWLWRMAMEPGRLWKRYLIDDMKFFRLVLRQKFGGSTL